MTDLTLCSIPLDLFKRAPDPEELGKVVASLTYDDAAKFIAAWSEGIRFMYPINETEHIFKSIGRAVVRDEAKFCHGYSSDLLNGIVAPVAAATP